MSAEDPINLLVKSGIAKSVDGKLSVMKVSRLKEKIDLLADYFDIEFEEVGGKLRIVQDRATPTNTPPSGEMPEFFSNFFGKSP